ncbi:glycosyltransferase family 2 protein [Micromonosporaceae bacterium Da 78-11]
MTSTHRLATTIVIPTRSDARWHSLVRTIASARSQTLTAAEIVVVVDHNTALFRRIRRDLGGVTVLENAYAQGVAGARNTGAFHAQTSMIAFLDDDTSADPLWLDRLIRPFADPRVVGAGGGINPDWARSRPRWMPDEFLWAVGGAHGGDVRAASMLVRRSAFASVGGFRAGAADTDLRTRMSLLDDGLWSYVPDATVRCTVPAGRSTFTSFLRTCFADGRDHLRTPGSAMRGALLRQVTVAVRGRRLDQALRAGGVLAGVTATGVGGMVGSLLGRRTPQLELELTAA